MSSHYNAFSLIGISTRYKRAPAVEPAINPIASMQAVKNDALGDIAEEIRGKLRRAIDAL